MVNVVFARRIYQIKNLIYLFFDRYRKIFYTLICLFILGLAVGVFSAFEMVDSLTIVGLRDNLIINIFIDRTSNISFFLGRAVVFLLLISIIFCCGYNTCLIPINVIILFYQSYFIGLNCAILIIAFNFVGIINIFLLLLPCYLIIIFAYIGFSCICIKNACERHKFGMLQRAICRECHFPMLIFICIGVLGHLLECWFLNIIIITV
ncbi:MAG: hypothetical protein WCX32_02005 [Clostridia bacterium]|jgi:uncharacterized protein YacL|nr:hypothetical protein [Clostridia bacterium]MDD4275982.1 hypothetical protein [Clostridia bacterium]